MFATVGDNNGSNGGYGSTVVMRCWNSKGLNKQSCRV
jgi:hypothetical protein